MRLVSFGSGSCGNSIYAGNDKTHFLVDVGISRKRIVEGLGQMGIEPEQLSGILITHEHIDHISGLGVFLRKYRIPVYATGKTIDKILETEALGEFPKDLFASIEPDTPTKIDGITVEASHIYHDAADPVCYSFKDEKDKVGIATDFGTFTDYLVEKMRHCSSLIVESNHDLNMLMVGPYPYPLKQRIMGNNGHLSNERAGQFLSKVIGEECRHILLGHLSKENNYGDLAYETVKVELYAHNIRIEEEPFTLKVAARDAVTFCGEEAEEEQKSEMTTKAEEKTTYTIVTEESNMKKTIITVLGKDRVGIIAKVCTYLANNNINILDINQTITGGYFNMMMIVESDEVHKTFPLMAEELAQIGEEIGVRIQAQHEEIFEMMHRI